MTNGLIKKLKTKDPHENFCSTAVETLKAKSDIRQFFKEYMGYLKEKGASETVRENYLIFAAGIVKGTLREHFRGIPTPVWDKVITEEVMQEVYQRFNRLVRGF